jgi:hypothetical protein
MLDTPINDTKIIEKIERVMDLGGGAALPQRTERQAS